MAERRPAFQRDPNFRIGRPQGGDRPWDEPAKPKPVGRASREQRAAVKAAESGCLVTGDKRVDPAHLAPRALGGCDDPLCTVPLRRDVHRAFDEGQLDLLPHLLAHGLVPEIQHALGHYRGDLVALLHRLTGERYAPEREGGA